MRICYFAPDAFDPNARRRIASLVTAHIDLDTFSFARPGRINRELDVWWSNVDLGLTADRAYGRRVLAVLRAIPTVWGHRTMVKQADVLMARNIDMFVLAQLFRFILRVKSPLVYEVLDIQPVMLSSTLLGRLLRALERWLLRSVTMLAVSSDAFVSEYFSPVQRFRGQTYVAENRLVLGDLECARPVHRGERQSDAALVIGWVGALRCERSLRLLAELAVALPDRVKIRLHGVPNGAVTGDLLTAAISGLPNVKYLGEYLYPDDLQEVYAGLDISWCGDFSAEDGNSKWLLPNRIYEGGFFGVPMVAPAGSHTAEAVADRGLGWVVDEPLARRLVSLIESLDFAEIDRISQKILAMPDSSFLDGGELALALEGLLP